jgi:hypothetical protein
MVLPLDLLRIGMNIDLYFASLLLCKSRVCCIRVVYCSDCIQIHIFMGSYEVP